MLKLPQNNLSELRSQRHLVAAAVEKLVTVDLEATHITGLAEEIFRKERAHLINVSLQSKFSTQFLLIFWPLP